MISVGDKVYVWDESDFFQRRWEGIIGDVVAVGDDCIKIKSIMDDETYTVKDIETVYHVGTGPVMSHSTSAYDVDEIFQDIPDDPDNVIMNIPPVVSASLGLDIGDTLVVESLGEGLVLRKKDPDFQFDEYEKVRAQKIEDTEPYDPDNSEGC